MTIVGLAQMGTSAALGPEEKVFSFFKSSNVVLTDSSLGYPRLA